MTKFSGPLIVGPAFSESTAATIDASGTATFTGNLNVTGTTTVSGTTTFAVSPQSNQGGKALFVAQATIIQSNTVASPVDFNLPSGANLVDFVVDVENPFTTEAGATAFSVILSAKNVALIADISVSASGRYTLGGTGVAGGYVAANASAMRNVTATLQAHVSVQGSNTAVNAGQAMLSVHYIV